MLNLIGPLFISSFMFGLVPVLDKRALSYYKTIEKYSVYRLIAYAVFTSFVILGYCYYMKLSFNDLKKTILIKSTQIFATSCVDKFNSIYILYY